MFSSEIWQSNSITDKTSLKADREDWGGVPSIPPQNRGKTKASGTTGTGGPEGPRKPTNPLNPAKIRGKLINTHQNCFRNHQGSSTISQNHFLIHFATKSNTNPKGHGTTGALIEVQSPSEGITHAGPIKISRFGHTPQPPILGDTKIPQRSQEKTKHFWKILCLESPKSEIDLFFPKQRRQSR